MRTAAASSARRKKTRKAPAKVTPLVKATDPVEEFINTWSPKDKTFAAAWPRVADVVRALVTQAKPGSTDLAGKYLRALARHAAARIAAGMRVDDVDELLSDAALASTLGTTSSSTLSENSRRTELSFIRRIRERVLPEKYGQPKELSRLRKSRVAKPYTDEEITELLTWCRSAKHPKAPRLRAAVLLSVACGLDGYEAPKVTGTDVLVTDWGLVVRAPGMAKSTARPARLVPVLAEFETELASLASKAGAGLLLGQTHDLNDLADATKKTPSVPVFNASRGRSTWTRSALVAGATVVALRQAGVSMKGDGVLQQLSQDLVLPMDEYVTMLRGGATQFDPTVKAFAGLPVWSQS